jgi:hypothetical protein
MADTNSRAAPARPASSHAYAEPFDVRDRELCVGGLGTFIRNGFAVV